MTHDEEKSLRELLEEHITKHDAQSEMIVRQLASLQARDVDLAAGVVKLGDTLSGAAAKAEQAKTKALAAMQVAGNIEGDQAAVLSQLSNLGASVRRLEGKLDGAEKFAADAPDVMARMDRATATLEKASAAAAATQEKQEKATEALEKAAASLSTAALWRKLRVPAIGLVSAIMTALAGRFVLPPAAPNGPNTLLPGPTPTVAAVPAPPGRAP